MERKPVILTVLCRVLRERSDIDFLKLHNRLCELRPDYPDDGDGRKLTYSVGEKRYSIKTGRFLKKRLGLDLSDMELQTVAAEINVELHGHLISVHTGDSIYVKYCTLGINSCMAAGKVPKEFFKVYADNPKVVSLAVCQTQSGAARCLIWKASDVGNEVMLYDRLYANCETARKELKRWCEERGYKPVNAVTASYVVKVNSSYDKYPYMDSFCYLSESKTVLSNKMAAGVRWKARSTHGVIGSVEPGAGLSYRAPGWTGWTEPELEYCDDENCEGFYICQDCQERISEHDLHDSSFDHRVTMCESCFEEHYYQCCNCSEYVEHHETYSDNGDTYCEHCYWEIFTSCNDCGEHVPQDNTYWIEELERDVCECCYHDNYSECPECGYVVSNDNLEEFEIDDDYVNLCVECAKSVSTCDKCEEISRDCVEMIDDTVLCPKCMLKEHPEQVIFDWDGAYFVVRSDYRRHDKLVKDYEDIMRKKRLSAFAINGWPRKRSEIIDKIANTKGLTMVRGPLEIMWPREDGIKKTKWPTRVPDYSCNDILNSGTHQGLITPCSS